MLTGSNPLHMPAYANSQPAVVMLSCACRRRYVVLTGAADQGGELLRRLAEARGALFVDARVVPFMNCECGEALDFSEDEMGGAVM